MQYTWPHAVLNPDLPSVSTVYNYMRDAVPLCQSGSRYFSFFSRIYQKKIVIPVGRLVRLLADRLSVG